MNNSLELFSTSLVKKTCPHSRGSLHPIITYDTRPNAFSKSIKNADGYFVVQTCDLMQKCTLLRFFSIFEWNSVHNPFIIRSEKIFIHLNGLGHPMKKFSIRLNDLYHPFRKSLHLFEQLRPSLQKNCHLFFRLNGYNIISTENSFSHSNGFGYELKMKVKSDIFLLPRFHTFKQKSKTT